MAEAGLPALAFLPLSQHKQGKLYVSAVLRIRYNPAFGFTGRPLISWS